MCENEVRDAFRTHYKWTGLEYSQLVVSLAFQGQHFLAGRKRLMNAKKPGWTGKNYLR